MRWYDSEKTWRLIGWGIIVGIIIFCLGMFLGEKASSATLEEYLNTAVSQNAHLLSAKEKADAARSKAILQGALPDPSLGVAAFGESIQTRVGPQINKYSLVQPLGNPGRLDLNRKIALASAGIAELKYQITRRDLVHHVKKIYYNIYLVDRSIEILKQEKSILTSMQNVARRKYEGNLVTQQDPLKAELALTAIIERTYTLEQKKGSLRALLKEKINDIGLEISEIKKLNITEQDQELAEIIDLASQYNQELNIARLKLEQGEFNKKLGDLRGHPNFAIGADYINIGSGKTNMDNDGQDAWAATFKMNLPIWFEQDHAYWSEKQSIYKSARDEYQDVKNKVNYAAKDSYYKLEKAKNILELYRSAYVPLANQAFEAARISYEAGKTDFLNWLDSEKKLLDVEIGYHKAIVEHESAAADLDRVIGISSVD